MGVYKLAVQIQLRQSVSDVKKAHCTAYTHVYVLGGKLAGNGSAENLKGPLIRVIQAMYLI